VRLLARVVGLVAFLGVLLGLSVGVYAETWTGRVVRVIDGSGACT
jgi:hypothetical protein